MVSHGDFEMLEPEHPTVCALTRTLGEETLLVLGNLSSVPLDLPLATAGEFRRNYFCTTSEPAMRWAT